MMDEPPEACPRISIPLHTVIQLTPTAYGCEERRIELSRDRRISASHKPFRAGSHERMDEYAASSLRHV